MVRHIEVRDSETIRTADREGEEGECVKLAVELLH